MHRGKGTTGSYSYGNPLNLSHKKNMLGGNRDEDILSNVLTLPQYQLVITLPCKDYKYC